MCVSWGVDVEDSFLHSAGKYVAMVTAYNGQKMEQILYGKLHQIFKISFHDNKNAHLRILLCKTYILAVAKSAMPW